MGNGSRLPDAVPRTRNARVRTTLVSRGTPARGDARRRASAGVAGHRETGRCLARGREQQPVHPDGRAPAGLGARPSAPARAIPTLVARPPADPASTRPPPRAEPPATGAGQPGLRTDSCREAPARGVRPGLHVGRGPQSAKRWAFRVRYTRAPRPSQEIRDEQERRLAEPAAWCSTEVTLRMRETCRRGCPLPRRRN